jgi:PAS domain-containing protein
MVLADMLDWVGLIAISLVSAGLAVFLFRESGDALTPSHTVTGRQDEQGTVLLFSPDGLIDATPAGETFLDGDPTLSEWDRLAAHLAPGFPNFPPDFQSAIDGGRSCLSPVDPMDKFELVLEPLDGTIRIELRTQRHDAADPSAENIDVSVLLQDLNAMQTAADASPFPAWQLLESGVVGWHNLAYAQLYRELHGIAPNPHKPILQTLLDSRSDNGTVRSSITIPGSNRTWWFDVSVVRHDRFSMFYAQDVDTVVRAETAQRNFVQTLAKTFAQLSTGLAIFDRDRRLVLFNPALVDLTSLPADFLSMRPDLSGFFDRLRDNQMMPEPKDYGSWREQIANLVAAAADGSYQETWSLPSGSVHQISGRPHPDGAVAFLFEDITAEVTLTRRFRSDLELGQSILDTLDDAMAVFSAARILIFSNAAYRALWLVDPDQGFADVTSADAVRDWRAGTRESARWKELLGAIADPSDRQSHTVPVVLTSGAPMQCRVVPIQAGAKLVSFCRTPQSTGPNRAMEILSTAS